LKVTRPTPKSRATTSSSTPPSQRLTLRSTTAASSRAAALPSISASTPKSSRSSATSPRQINPLLRYAMDHRFWRPQRSSRESVSTPTRPAPQMSSSQAVSSSRSSYGRHSGWKSRNRSGMASSSQMARQIPRRSHAISRQIASRTGNHLQNCSKTKNSVGNMPAPIQLRRGARRCSREQRKTG